MCPALHLRITVTPRPTRIFRPPFGSRRSPAEGGKMKEQMEPQSENKNSEASKAHADNNGLTHHPFRAFAGHIMPHTYPKGTTLFSQGETAEGVYLLRVGRVKMMTYSEDGRSIIVRVAESGEILGLPACVAGLPYESSAQAMDPCCVAFVRKSDFLTLLKSDPGAALNAIQELSLLYHKAHTQICTLGLSASAADRLAKLFLEWSQRSDSSGAGAHIRMTYTHEELAEMIGTSRETVTRLIRAFKDLNLIQLKGNDLFIPDTETLERSIGTGTRLKQRVI